MKKLYLDCDGVILDTITRSYQMLRERAITSEEEISKFYSNLCWEKLIEESGEINDSISKIRLLMNYFDIEILTHVNSKKEAMVKIKYFGEILPGINVIWVPKITEKADVVDPVGAILVDDFSPNLDYWYSKGGIAVKFSDSGRESVYPVIEDLLELVDLFNRNKSKVKE